MQSNHRVTVALRIKPPGEAGAFFQTVMDHVFQKEKNADIYNVLFKDVPGSPENATILTYGRTGTGKTHTMFGDGSEQGIVQMLLRDFLRKKGPLRIRCMEVYNEVVTDVLSGAEIRLVQDKEKTVLLANQANEIRTDSEMDRMLDLLKKKKRTAQTEYNHLSSRSHTVLEVSAAGLSVHLVDLAGNEKVSETPLRKKEGLLINKSLLTLGKIIDQLHDGVQHISYRESKLTRILQNTIGTGSIFCICNVLGTQDHQTIKFGERLKRINIKKKPKEKTKDEIISELMEQVQKLKRQIAQADPSQSHTLEPQQEILPVAQSPASVLAIVDRIRVSPPRPRMDIYEMLYGYFREEEGTNETPNSLPPQEKSQVTFTTTQTRARHVPAPKPGQS